MATRKPKVPVEKVNPFDTIILDARAFREAAYKCNHPEDGQQILRKIDNILKDIAELQKEVGGIRRETAQRIGLLRKEKPKGPPPEGTIKTLESGKSFIYIDKSWQPYAEEVGSD